MPQQEDYAEIDLMAAFNPFGKVVSVKIMTERNPTANGTQPRTGIGFVRFNTEEEARNALVNLSSKQIVIKGRAVRLEAKYADKQASTVRNNSHAPMPALVPHVSGNILPHMQHKLIPYYSAGNNVPELMYVSPETMLQRQISLPKNDIEGITRSTECLNLEEQKKTGRLDSLNPAYGSYGPNQWSGNPQPRFNRRPKVRYPGPCIGASIPIASNQRQQQPHPAQMHAPVPPNVGPIRGQMSVQQQSVNKNDRSVMAIPNYMDADALTNYQIMTQQRRPDGQTHGATAVVMPPAGGVGGQYATGYNSAVSPPQFYSLPPQGAVPCNQGVPVYYQSLQLQNNGGMEGDQSIPAGMGQTLPPGTTSISSQGFHNMVYSPRGQPPPHAMVPQMQPQSAVGHHWNPSDMVSPASAPPPSLALNGLGRPGGCQIQQQPMPQPQQSYGPPNGCVPFQVVMPGSRIYPTMTYPAAAACPQPATLVHQQQHIQQMACLSEYGNQPTATHSQLSVPSGQTTESASVSAAKS